MTRRVLDVGERGLLIECADLDEVRALTGRLTEEPLDGQREVVPAARTVLVLTSGARARARVREQLAGLVVGTAVPVAGREVVVETVYDGEDLAEVARLTGQSVDGVIARHSGGTWSVAFLGFAPGFAYLVGDSPPVPRRVVPRPTVPAGSVAVAGPYSAVYPRRSPGGWQLLGRTALEVWDLDREPPALLVPGTTVRFRPVRDVVRAAAPTVDADAGPVPVDVRGPALEVVTVGAQALVEDLGRRGLLALGVAVSGAADRGSALRANRLVGNPAGAAVVECVLGGLVVRAVGRQVLALGGAPAPAVVEEPGADGPGVEVALDRPFALPDGHVLRLGEPATGSRTYLAVRGGLDLPLTLGSRSTDVLAALGPPPLRPGARLPVGDAAVDAVAGWPEPGPSYPGEVVVRVRPGPREDWLAPPGLDRLVGTTWTVGDQSNRVGLRLVGEPLVRASAQELESEGLVRGAVQVPPSGLPVVFLVDHPVTGGYPVVAVVVEADLDLLGQARPGQVVRLVIDGADDARPPAGTDPPAGSRTA